MSIVTIRPDSTVFNNTTLTGPTPHGATSDNTDDTHIEMPMSSYTEAVLGMGTYAVPGLSYVAQVRVRIRYRTMGGGAITLWYTRMEMESGHNHDPIPIQAKTATPIVFTSGWVTTAPDGSAWSQTDVDTLRIRVQAGFWTGNTELPRIYEIYVDLDVRTRPVTTVSAPSGAVTTTTKPPVVFTYSDVDTDPMEAYKIRIFTTAQTQITGFDAATSPCFVESGYIYAAAPPSGGWIPTKNLDNNTSYVAYVWVYEKGFQGNVGESLPVTTSFNLALAGPSVPTIARSSPSQKDRITIQVQTGGGSPTTTAIEIWKRFGANGGFTDFQLIKRLEGVGAGVVTYDDYAAVPNATEQIVSNHYRARSFAANGLNSNYTSEISATLVDDEWRLKDLSFPVAYNILLQVKGPTPIPITHTEDKAFFNPLGRSRKVGISDVIKGVEFSLPLVFTNETDWFKFQQMRERQNTLLLQAGWLAKQWHVQITQTTEEELFGYVGPYREVTVGFIEVDEPDV